MTDIFRTYNGVSLAYLGDAVLELKIRERLLTLGVTDTGRLSAAAQKLVCAPAQSAIAEKLLPLLSAEEEAAYKLGRNHHANGKPKRASVAEYSRATGLEALFGYLYLAGEVTRLDALFSSAYDEPIESLRDRI